MSVCVCVSSSKHVSVLSTFNRTTSGCLLNRSSATRSTVIAATRESIASISAPISSRLIGHSKCPVTTDRPRSIVLLYPSAEPSDAATDDVTYNRKYGKLGSLPTAACTTTISPSANAARPVVDCKNSSGALASSVASVADAVALLALLVDVDALRRACLAPAGRAAIAADRFCQVASPPVNSNSSVSFGIGHYS
jgi:hypothetical protein